MVCAARRKGTEEEEIALKAISLLRVHEDEHILGSLEAEVAALRLAERGGLCGQGRRDYDEKNAVHASVVQLHEVVLTPKSAYLVLELAEVRDGTLQTTRSRGVPSATPLDSDFQHAWLAPKHWSFK